MSQMPSAEGKVLLAHPTGNSNTRAAAEALHRSQLLHSFHTCVAVGEGSRNPIKKKLYARRQIHLPDKLIQTHPWRELIRLALEKTGILPQLRAHEAGAFCVDRIYQELDASVAKSLRSIRPGALAAVYAYEDGALATFRAADQKPIHCFYDLPIGYWRTALKIQSEEAELRPGWRDTMPALIDSEEKLRRKDAELQSSDSIIVASQFTARTLQDAPFPIPKPHVIPYACPPAQASISPVKSHFKGKIRVLYVGSLSQRKGLADLLDAISSVGEAAELTIIGRRVGSCKPLDAALRQHRWIESLPHTEILREMRQHDVLAFPSLFEGFGLVITEALSQGIPVIATDHTCAPDIITDGQEGYIVPIRNPSAIAEKLILLHDDRELLDKMKEDALSCAASLSPLRYTEQLIECIQQELKP